MLVHNFIFSAAYYGTLGWYLSWACVIWMATSVWHNPSMQIVSEKDQEQSALFKRRPGESVPENSAENIYEISDFLNEEYLELNDLYSPDNSRLISVNSDEEYFDPVALLSEIGNGHVSWE